MTDKLSPSLMCLDFAKIPETLAAFKTSGIELLHTDIMDGVFVPNYTLGIDFCNKMRKMSSIPLDLHLMIERPEDKLAWFGIQPGEYVSVHAETCKHLQRALAQIRSYGAHPMVALNPATPLSALDYVLDDIDGVLVMTVNPGFAGQKLIPAMLKKITDCRNLLDRTGHGNVEIEVDGNVSFAHAPEMKQAGANIFVGGSSSVFAKDASIEDNITHMRKVLKEA